MSHGFFQIPNGFLKIILQYCGRVDTRSSSYRSTQTRTYIDARTYFASIPIRQQKRAKVQQQLPIQLTSYIVICRNNTELTSLATAVLPYSCNIFLWNKEEFCCCCCCYYCFQLGSQRDLFLDPEAAAVNCGSYHSSHGYLFKLNIYLLTQKQINPLLRTGLRRKI